MISASTSFDYLKIKLASPGRILEWSTRQLPNGQFVGEVQRSETINYRSFKPEMDGLFCERIFGPNKSFECYCGKYKQVRYYGLICERCGVELTESSVRRHRMGYIKLIYPVTHIWYIHSRPNFISLLLEIEDCEKTLFTTYTSDSESCDTCDRWKPLPADTVNLWDERIKRLKLASFVYFTADNEVDLYGLHWDLQEYRKNRIQGETRYSLKPHPKPPVGRSTVPKYLLQATPNFLFGTALLKRELEKLDLPQEIEKTRAFILTCTRTLEKQEPEYSRSHWFRKWEQQRFYKIRDQAIKRIRILENLVASESHPAWMIFTVLPVIPPLLRPMVKLERGRFATSDLNELYRRVMARNDRLRKLLAVDAPPSVIRNEKRMLQESVDSLIDNGKRGKFAIGSNKRPLKSLSEVIKGKHGRFRQNLLGKRVDYSGRSVIVVGPSLKLNQCGLPYEMAMELFQPFIIHEFINQGLVNNMKLAKNLIEQNEKLTKSVLEKLLKNHPIFLNRAPTLHRLGVQAFQPILVAGRAIQLHPLVCSAFNADFDGDQMAVHIPLSWQAQSECQMLMLAPYNFLSPANGEPVIVPSQDMVLGCYYLTIPNLNHLLGSSHYFANFSDVQLAYEQNQIELHTTIWVRISDQPVKKTALLKIYRLPDESLLEYYPDYQVRTTKTGEILVQYLKTTTGHVILNDLIQRSLAGWEP